MDLPFKLTKVDHFEEGWEPELDKEYLVQYRWEKDERSKFLVGRFHSVWYGYTFSWFWGSSSLQLSTNMKGYTKDFESFIGIWELERLPEPERKYKQPNFITQGDIDI